MDTAASFLLIIGVCVHIQSGADGHHCNGNGNGNGNDNGNGNGDADSDCNGDDNGDGTNSIY
jgi:hypothetical protein